MDEAQATRAALHGVKWPQSNPKFLSVDFCLQEEVSTREPPPSRSPHTENPLMNPSASEEQEQFSQHEHLLETRHRGFISIIMMLKAHEDLYIYLKNLQKETEIAFRATLKRGFKQKLVLDRTVIHGFIMNDSCCY